MSSTAKAKLLELAEQVLSDYNDISLVEVKITYNNQTPDYIRVEVTEDE